MVPSRILVTGGAGFIGSTVIATLLKKSSTQAVLNFDALTYAGNLLSLQEEAKDPRYTFQRASVQNLEEVQRALEDFQPDCILHLAAETHVDRSLNHPQTFLETNVLGTGILLQATSAYWESLSLEKADTFRFLHVSTDEVFGSLGDSGQFHQDSPYAPTSPYSASKSAADHLVRSWEKSFGLPCIITHGSNCYGPKQFPEKLIPLIILQALNGDSLPVYGDGQQIRDWIHVQDQADAIYQAACLGKPGGTYFTGGGQEQTNLLVVETLCRTLEEIGPFVESGFYKKNIKFVQDRPGHDYRYSMDCRKTQLDLDWKPHYAFADGLRETVRWYLNNPAWVKSIQTGEYRQWMDENYGWR